MGYVTNCCNNLIVPLGGTFDGAAAESLPERMGQLNRRWTFLPRGSHETGTVHKQLSVGMGRPGFFGTSHRVGPDKVNTWRQLLGGNQYRRLDATGVRDERHFFAAP